jgi:hypothetical protein
VLKNVIENEDVTRALNDEGIDNIISLVKLTDDAVNNLTYLDPDSKIRVKLKLGPIGFIKSFIHYVHYREETSPICNAWKSITMNDFDQFSCNLKYVRRFASLSSLPTLDMTYVKNEPNRLDVSDVFNEIDVFDDTDDDDDESVLDEYDIFTVTGDLDIADIIETTNIDGVIDVTKVSDIKIVIVDVPNVLNVTDITEVNISDELCDMSSTSDIPQVTATMEVLEVHHQVDMEYDTNGPPVLSSSLTPCPSRPPKKPPYSNQCGNTNLHDMSPYESLQAHVHEVEPMLVSDDDSTDDLNHDDDDLYDASYEMDPFPIDTPVGTIQAYDCMDENVCMPKDKWFSLNQKN